MTTQIVPTTSQSAHWYAPNGEPRHFVPKKDGSGNRPTTLRDARIENLLPSVTTILQTLAKPQLQRWLIEQACMAVLTAPRQDSEALDAFMTRVLNTERQQDQESQIARDRGTSLHDALEAYWTGRPVPEADKPWVMPAATAIGAYGQLHAAEKVLVGEGYAGKTDLILESADCLWIVDYKTAKKLPDPKKGGAWSEHVTQCAAYALGLERLLAVTGMAKAIRTMNCYISTINEGQFVICEHSDWRLQAESFLCLVRYWQIQNEYYPTPVTMPAPAFAV